MKNTLLDLIKLRDQLFLEKFCEKGSFMGDEGRVVYVCKSVDPSEMLNFIHSFDEGILAAVNDN